MCAPSIRCFCLLVAFYGLIANCCAAELTALQRPVGATIIVGGDHDYPPYEFLDDNDQPAGFNVALTQAIAEVMGIEVEFRLESWDQARSALDSGEIDILQGMVFSQGRTRDYDFSPPHTIVHESVFARQQKNAHKTTAITSLEQLKGKSLIVQKRGIRHDQLLEQNIDAELILADTHAAALRLLASGQYDYALVGNLPGLYLGEEMGLSNIAPVGNPFPGQPYCYAVRKGDDGLLSLFSEGLAILKNTGRYQQIYDEWLGPLEPNQRDWRDIAPYVVTIVGAALLIIAATLLWNRALKREVARRTLESQQHQQQLIQADKMASLGVLVSGVAHEINNPNSLILHNVPILQAIYDDSHEIFEHHYTEHGDFSFGGINYSDMRDELPLLLSEMHDAGRRIRRIVDDLKDFGRVEGSTISEPVNINNVVNAAVRLLENPLQKATERFSQQLAADLPQVNGHGQRIEQVVLNLLLNACQSLPDPQCAISISTRYLAEQDQVVIEVSDEGAGIDPKHLQNLTDPFYTTKRDSGGTGLGLSVSATIAQQHDGYLDFQSTPGVGTVAQFVLPVKTGVTA